MTRRAAGEAGFVLPTVLAILVVIAGAAAVATRQMQLRTTMTTARLDGLRLQGLADGAARLVAVSLLNERARRLPGLGLPEDGTPIACALSGGVRLQIAVQDQAGLIDLNSSPRPLLEEAFRALGLADRDAATIAAEVVDDRDPDDVPEPSGGAEAAQYKARGLSYGPRNAPFTTIDALDRLPSMTPAIAAVLRPAVTVWNAAGGIDPTLNRLPALRQTVAGDRMRPYLKRSAHQHYEVRATAAAASGARSGRAVMLSADGRRSDPGLLSWRSSTVLSPNPISHPGCARIAMALEMPRP